MVSKADLKILTFEIITPCCNLVCFILIYIFFLSWLIYLTYLFLLFLFYSFYHILLTLMNRLDLIIIIYFTHPIICYNRRPHNLMTYSKFWSILQNFVNLVAYLENNHITYWRIQKYKGKISQRISKSFFPLMRCVCFGFVSLFVLQIHQYVMWPTKLNYDG